MNESNCFIEIEDYKNDIARILEEIWGKCEHLDIIYKQYLKQATKSPEYLTSLDTLFFQINLTKKDANNYASLFDLFVSQMYGQYYKLYIKIIHNLEKIPTEEIFKDITYQQHFTAYDDINLQDYSFEEIQSIHNLIISILSCINNYIQKQNFEIEDDTVRVNKGVSIDTLVFEKTHFANLLKNEYKLFECILNKYYDYQRKILKRIMLKLKLLYFQIDTDIQFESFNYSPRQSVTGTIDSKFKSIVKQRDFESILLQEFDHKNVIERPDFFTFISKYIIKFFSKFCLM